MTLPSYLDDVTCPECGRRLEACPRSEHNFPRARELFKVGNISTVEMGHQMYHTREGRVALCTAERRGWVKPYQQTIDLLAQTEAKCREQMRLARELTVVLAVKLRVEEAGHKDPEIVATSYDETADKRPRKWNFEHVDPEKVINVAVLKDKTRVVIPPVYPNRESVNGVFGMIARECSGDARKIVRKEFYHFRRANIEGYDFHFDAGLGCWTVSDPITNVRWQAVDDIPAYRVRFEELPKLEERMPTLPG